MALTAADVYTEARALLNDAGSNRYVDATLLPLIKKAYDELQNVLDLIGAAPIVETVTLTLPALTNKIAFTGGVVLPANLLEPFFMEEKATGSSEVFVPMRPTRMQDFPATTPTTLDRWTWVANEIRFPATGASTSRDVHIWYFTALAAITSGASAITVLNAKSFLASKTAAFVAAFIDGDFERASAINDDAQAQLDILLGKEAKRQQAVPVKRLPFGYSRRRGLRRTLR